MSVCCCGVKTLGDGAAASVSPENALATGDRGRRPVVGGSCVVDTTECRAHVMWYQQKTRSK